MFPVSGQTAPRWLPETGGEVEVVAGARPVDPAVRREERRAGGAGDQVLPCEGSGAVGGVTGEAGQAGQPPPGGVAGGENLYTGVGTSYTIATYNCGDSQYKWGDQHYNPCPASRRCCVEEEQG